MIFEVIEFNTQICYMYSDIQRSSICNWQQLFANLRYIFETLFIKNKLETQDIIGMFIWYIPVWVRS